MSLKKSKITSLIFSDVHLFHDKTKTEHILLGFYDALKDNERLRDIDIIFISGDLFDRAVFFPNPDVYLASQFVNYLLNMCEKYDIVLRVLEGTPSHDWKQSKIIPEMNAMRPNPCDVKHVTTLSIEYIEKFGMNVLYVPDEWGTSCSATFEEVKELLITKNLKQVDLAIMHGCFNFQFPANLVGKPDVHDENSYLGITKYAIVIGHYHTPCKFERIHVPGSLDRLKHGEEEDKGYLKLTMYDDGKYNMEFIVNPNAMIYKTFDVIGKSVEQINKIITNYLKDQQFEQYIRLLIDRDDVIYTGLKDLKSRYPLVHFSLQTKKKEKEKLVSQTSDIVRPPTLTFENIESLLKERLIDKYPDKVGHCIKLLRSIVNNE